MLARRLLLLAAVLLLVSTLAAGLTRRDPVTGAGAVGGPATALPAGTTVDIEIPAAKGEHTRVAVRRGDILQLEVAGDLLDSVLIERLDRIEAIAPEKKARFEMLVEAPAGAYPIRLIEADRRIGTIEISD